MCIGLSSCATKITDPNDPRFDVTKLKLEGFYKGKQDLCKALRIILPPGTPKDRVDYVLVDIGGAKEHKREGKEKSNYIYQSKVWAYNSKNIAVSFTKDNKVKKVCR